MDSKDIRNLQEAYNNVYELDEVRGGGRIDPVSDMSGIGERGARSPKDAGLLMSPLDRAKARANALTKKGNPKQANQINSRFIRPTERAVNRALLAATNAKHAEKTRLMQSEGSFDNLIDTGANIIKEPIQNYANKKVGGIAGSLGIPGAVAGQKVDQTASDLKKGNYGKALNTVVDGVRTLTQSVDLYDIILSHLIDEGYAETVENAESIMVNMSEDWRESIVEEGFNSSGRYDVGGGNTVGPVAGAVRSLFSGNLPKGQTYVPPSPQRGTNRPPTVPSSKGDSGKLTDFGAGGGKAKMQTGMSVGQVERQGRRNRGDYSV
jgi:hypothetical protein